MVLNEKQSKDPGMSKHSQTPRRKSQKEAKLIILTHKYMTAYYVENTVV
jgi:hypothetical protein